MLTDYPSIKQLFLRYNSILPSSAPVERLFSFGGMVNTPKRQNLGDELFEMLVLLKVNGMGTTKFFSLYLSTGASS